MTLQAVVQTPQEAISPVPHALSSRIEEALMHLSPVPSVAVVRTSDVEEIVGFELEGAIPARVREFVTTRMCAQEALAVLGLKAGRVGRSVQGEPIWPAGFRGSLTHCAGIRAALVIEAMTGIHVGIDIEPFRPLPPGVRERALTPAECAHQPIGRLDTLTFSAKEAAFKAWFPAKRKWMDFDEVEVAWRATDFVVTSAEEVNPGRLLARGRAVVLDNYIVTVASVG